MSQLPSVPTTDPAVQTLPSVPTTDPTLNLLISSPDRYSLQWFNSYDTASPDTRANFNRMLLKAMLKREKGWTYQGVVGMISQKRKQAERAKRAEEAAVRMKSRADKLAKLMPSVPTEEPKRSLIAFSIPPEIHAQCTQLYKEIEEFIGYTKDVEKFPEIDRKYHFKFFEELESLRERVKNECMLRGQVPERTELFAKMNSILEGMLLDMMEATKPQKEGRSGGTKRKGAKRKGTKRKGTKRKGTKRKGTKRKGTKRK